MYQFSDSDTPDSDDGRRFKTESTRKKIDKSERNYPKKYRSPSPRRNSDNFRRDRRRSRSRSPRRDRDRATHKDNRSRRHDEHTKSSRHSDECKKIKVEDNLKGKNDESKSSSSSTSKTVRSKRKDYEDSSPRKQRSNGKVDECIDVDDFDLNKKESYGPSLPPTLLKSKDIIEVLNNSSDKESNEKLNLEETDVGLYKPIELPTQKTIEETTPIEPTNQQTTEAYGPSLPPALTQKNPRKDAEKSSVNPPPIERNIGPSLPAHLREKLANAAVEIPHGVEEDPKGEVGDPKEEIGDQNEEVGDQNEEVEDAKEEVEEQEEEDALGPLPPGMIKNSQAHIALEERALQMKIDTLSGPGDDAVKREEWMIELPVVRSANLGLGPRQFRAKPTPDMSDRSSWTETPEDKIKKQAGEKKVEVDIRKEAEINLIRKRDEEQEKMIKKHKKSSKNNDKSLLEIHQYKLKDKKDEEGPGVRRPFSREVDLKVNRFDDAQKKAILKKAQLLDTRFSSGQSKFL